jgi:hypothetical protein
MWVDHVQREHPSRPTNCPLVPAQLKAQELLNTRHYTTTPTRTRRPCQSCRQRLSVMIMARLISAPDGVRPLTVRGLVRRGSTLLHNLEILAKMLQVVQTLDHTVDSALVEISHGRLGVHVASMTSMASACFCRSLVSDRRRLSLPPTHWTLACSSLIRRSRDAIRASL